MKKEIININEKRKVSIIAYIQEVDGEFTNIHRRPAVLILPGGGYAFCSEREADPVAMEYAAAGYQCFILYYSVGSQSIWPEPLGDYEKAMEMIIERADEWHVIPDKVAVVGFSAGGHLAGCAATMSKLKPAAAVMGYPALKGELIKMCMSDAPDVISAVDRETSPCFVFATRTDDVVPVVNSLDFVEALNKNGISYECHIYAFGPHGFSTAKDCVSADIPMCGRVSHWVEDSIAWLGEMLGTFGRDGMTVPKCKRTIGGDFEVCLSVDCSVSKLIQNKEAMAILKPVFMEILPYFQERGVSDVSSMPVSAELVTFRHIMEMAGISKQRIMEMDNELRKIPV